MSLWHPLRARRWYVAAFAVLVLLTACASTLARHAFSFEANEEPGIEILDYRYGESRQPGAWPDPSVGWVRQGANIIGEMRRPDALYVRWRDETSGKVYEDTVDLARLLPRDITDHRIHFTVRGPQLFVYLITPQLRSPTAPPVGPREFNFRKVITLSSDFGREVSTSNAVINLGINSLAEMDSVGGFVRNMGYVKVGENFVKGTV
jgi:hypothetical protein